MPGLIAVGGCRDGERRLRYNLVVVDQAAEARTDRIFHALSDPTRRDIVARAVAGELSVSALARGYAMSLTAVQKHVAVLETADLVEKRRRGREQLVVSRFETLRGARRVLDDLEALWRDRIDRFGEVLAELTEPDPKNPQPRKPDPIEGDTP